MSRVAKFDKVVLGELSSNFFGAGSIKAKAMFVAAETGRTYGSLVVERWSPAVLQKLAELRALMESELERTVFEDGGDQGGSPDGSISSTGGLAEHLLGDEPPPI